MLAAVKILQIQSIHLLELINSRALLRVSCFLSKWWVRGVLLPAVKLHLLITHVCTCGVLFSQRF